MNLCSQCGRNFTGISSFDMHQRVLDDERGTVQCLDPIDAGLEEKPVRKYNGKHYQTWGMLAAAEHWSTQTKDNTMETTLIRKCVDTGKPFVAWGKGRPPERIGQGRAVEVVTPIGNVGKWLDRDGNVYDDRPGAVATKPAKAAAKAPAKPATAKPVKAARPADAPAAPSNALPIPRTAVVVPPPPPAAVVDGKTLVQALADGDVHPDTFADPPFAEDAYDSLYGAEGISPDALERPEPDEYMHTLLASGTLRGYSIA